MKISELRFTCIVHPCGKKRKKGSGFCTAHKASHKGTIASHPRGLCPLDKASGTSTRNPKPRASQVAKNKPESGWEGNVGYKVN